MAKNNETTTKFKVDISELVSGMQKAKRQIALANAEFKSATAGMDNWAKSANGITAKLSQLDKTLTSQKSILSNLEKQYELTAQQMGEDSKEAENLRIKIENQKASIGKTESQIKTYTKSLSDIKAESNRSKTAVETLSDTIETQERELKDLKTAYANAVLEYGKNSKEAKALATHIRTLSGELNDSRSAMREASETSADLSENIDEAGESAEESSGGFTVMKGALASLVADGIKKAVSALSDFAKASVAVGSDFEASMSEVSAISGATGKDFELLEQTAKDYGATTVFSASESAQALKYMALAGWDAKTSAEGLGGVLALASASGMDLAQASDMVTDYLSAFGMTADQSTYFADMLAYAQSNANTSAEQLGEAYKNCGATLNASGQDVETVTSLLSMMANQGFKGSEAGTALTAIMRDMTAKMKNGAIAIGNTSVTVMDANGNYRDMTDILKDVESATNGMGDAERATALSTTFTADSTKGLNLLLNAGIGTAEEFEQALRGASGTAEDMGDTMNDNLKGDLKQAESGLEDLQITAYDELQPALREIVQYATQNIIPMIKNDVIPAIKDDILPAIKEFIGWIVDNKDVVIAGIAGIGGAFVAWNVVTMIQGVVSAIKAFKLANEGATVAQLALNLAMSLNPIGIIIALIAGLVAAFVVLWNKSEGFRNFFIGLWDGIKSVVGTVVDAIAGFFSGLWDTITGIFSGLATWFNNNVIQPIINFFSPIVETIVGFFTGLWDGIVAVFSPAIEWFTALFTSIWNTLTSVIDVIVGLVQGCWAMICRIFEVAGSWFNENVIQPVVGFFTGLWNTISSGAKAVWNAISSVFSTVAGWFNKTLIQPVTNFFSGMWNKLKSGASNAWNGIKSVFSSVANFFGDIFGKAWKKVKDVFSVGGKIFDGIKDGIVNAFKSVVNAIIKGINKVVAIPFNAINAVLDKIRNISFLGISPFKGLFKDISVPQIPELYRGGVLRKGQVGYLEGNGDEAVVPLEHNTGWLDEVASRIVAKGGVVNSQPQTVNNNYNYEYNQTNNSPKALSRLEIYRQTKNQFNYAVGGNV